MNDKQPPLSKSKPNSNTTPQQKKQAQPKTAMKQRSSSITARGIIWLLLIIIVAALLLAGGYCWQWQQKQERQLQTLSQRLALISQSQPQQPPLKTLHSSVTALQTAHDQQQLELSTLQAKITQQQQQITGLENSKQQPVALNDQPNNNRFIAEALYLSRLANYSLWIKQSPTTSIRLLKSADQLLKQADNPQTLAARRAVATDIAKLQTIPTVDITGIYVKLHALSQQIPNLRLLGQNPEQRLTNNDNATTATVSKSKSWKRYLQLNNKLLSKLVVIQRHELPIQPLLSAEQRSLLTQYLSLQVSNAQWALLQRQQNIYRLSLKQLQTAIKLYAVTDNLTTKQTLTTIATLQALNIAPSLPDISNSLATIKTLYQRNRVTAPTTTDNQNSHLGKKS